MGVGPFALSWAWVANPMVPSTLFEYTIAGNGIDFGLCVSSGQVFRWQFQNGIWRGSIGSAGFEVTEVGLDPSAGSDGPAGGLSVRSNVPPGEFVRIFGTDRTDGQWFGEVLSRDPDLAVALECCRGLRLIQQDDPVETLFSFICSANNHVSRIEAMVRRLAGYGPEPGFPSLEALAGINSGDLRTVGFGYRAERIPAAASAVIRLGGRDWLDGLKSLESVVAVQELQALPGVGPKVAECVALFGLGHGDVVPIDTHIWNAVCRRYFPDMRGLGLTPVRRKLVGDHLRERFGSEAGLAHLVLFVDELKNWRHRRKASPARPDANPSAGRGCPARQGRAATAAKVT